MADEEMIPRWRYDKLRAAMKEPSHNMIRVPLPDDLPDTCRRYPRTLEEAFGPYQRQSIVLEREPEPGRIDSLMLAAFRWVYAVFLAIFMAFIYCATA